TGLAGPERGGGWARYLADTGGATAEVAARLLAGIEPEPRDEVTLTDFDPDGEIKVVAAALYAPSRLPDDQLLAVARKLGPEERRQVLEAYVGARTNRRHKPGRAFERTSYRFDVLGDYGAFRDLQRHRLLTLEWQPLSPRHGWRSSEEIVAPGDGGGRAALRGPRRRGARRGSALRSKHGLPHALLPGAQRARGDAHDRAPHDAPGAPLVSPGLPGHASPHRHAGWSSRHRG